MPAEKIKVEDGRSEAGHTMIEMGLDMSSAVPLKKMILLFLLYMLLNNDVFIGRVLSRMSSSFVDEMNPTLVTTRGTVAVGIILVLGLLVIEVATKKEII
jgi:hypothetical protein